ncbi:MAG: hypothetical protein H8E55_21240 [Pelagibacterales bacterium]|nr:hypothetical protein [Pelagibacterales bacterium]
MHYIYIFYDPDTKLPLYVGRSKSQNLIRFKQHLRGVKRSKYIRHPFHCKLQSLHSNGYSYEDLLNCFKIIKQNLTLKEAISHEDYYINTKFGIENLLNICRSSSFGGDTFTHNPNKEHIRLKLKGRTPWNKGKKFPGKISSTSFKPDIPRIKYFLTSPAGERFEVSGVHALKEFCNDWRSSHNAVSFKDPNWISPTALQMGTTLKGWQLIKIPIS